GSAPLMGRTRMQAATEITVRDRIAPWLLPLADHRARLAQLRPRVAKVQVGGASGDRFALGEMAGQISADVAQALDLGDPPRAWHAMRDGVAEFASFLSLVTGTLGKMGQDIALMAQQGISEITLSGGGASSAMPHKQNPVMAELLVTLARFNAVQVSAMHQALVHEQERSGAAWALEWMVLPQMAQATGRALTVAQTLTGQIKRIGMPE
ncbi:MAG TPA: lyase family protein, partial [Paenirhodobacter sp.]